MNYKKAVRVATAMQGDSIQDYSDKCGISIQAMYKRFRRQEPLHSWVTHLAEYAGVSLNEIQKWGE